MNTLPLFYVGQRVVCIKSHSEGYALKNTEYVLTGVHKSCCGWDVTTGIETNTTKSLCGNCNKVSENKTGEVLIDAAIFAPIQTDFQEITYEEIMEKESRLINAN